ncbi:hypothetical protein I317_01285 [Kwoniella heveanensis CBS 569]|nr:hypothetical protein I317_01285 [Kwoniella heveanensis CBS 569]
MCCCEADWKREVVPDHKFDFINIREFHKTDIWTRIKYIFKYVFFLKSVAVYGFDIFTAVTMILSSHWTNAVQRRCGDDCAIEVKFDIAKWVFVGCIIFSFLLLAYETWKTKRVIDSRDISYAFTNLMANDYYSFKAYDNFCLFCHIENSTKKKDDFAFFVFFTFKGWKRLLLADGPRQSINALILYSFAYANGFQTDDIPAYWDNSAVTAMLLFAMITTVLIFAGSLLLLIIAAVCYVPLLCYIQGNLKEYVCHKVDKRISELIKKKQRQRIARNAALEKKLAQGGIKNAKGEIITGAIPQPTLPQIDLDDDNMSERATRIKAERSGQDVPSRPSPGPSVGGSGYGYPPGGEYGVYGENSVGYQEDYGSSTNLMSHAASMGISYPPVAASQPTSQTGYPFPPSRSHSDLQRYGPGSSSGRTSPYAAVPRAPSHGGPPGSYEPDLGYEPRRDSEHSGLAYDDPYGGMSGGSGPVVVSPGGYKSPPPAPGFAQAHAQAQAQAHGGYAQQLPLPPPPPPNQNHGW